MGRWSRFTRGEDEAWKTEKCESVAEPVPEPWEGRRGRDESESEASRFVSFRMLEEVVRDLGNGVRLYKVSVSDHWDTLGMQRGGKRYAGRRLFLRARGGRAR